MICIYACLSTRSEIRCEVAGIAYSVNQGRAESSSGAGARGKKKVEKKWVHYYFIFLQQVTYGHQACIYLIYIKIDFMQC